MVAIIMIWSHLARPCRRCRVSRRILGCGTFPIATLL